MTDWLDYYLVMNEPIVKLSSSVSGFFDVLIPPPMYIKGSLDKYTLIGFN